MLPKQTLILSKQTKFEKKNSYKNRIMKNIYSFICYIFFFLVSEKNQSYEPNRSPLPILF